MDEDDPRFDAILDMNDPQFAEKFMDALGLNPGDTVNNIATPQFNREDGVQPALSVDDWQGLRNQPATALSHLGCRAWEEPDAAGRCLMLFPAEWYDLIPDGFQVETIPGKHKAFEWGSTDDDKRFGVLAYGVRVKDDLDQTENA